MPFRRPNGLTLDRGLGLGVVLFLLLVVSCAPAEKPAEGWVLRDMATGNLTSTDPVRIPDALSINILSNVYEGLVGVSPEGKLIPGLAESWTHSADMKTWTFKLRKGVKFQPAPDCHCQAQKRDMNSADVAFSIRRSFSDKRSTGGWALIALVKGASEYASGKIHDLSGLQTPDEYTIVIELTRPFNLLSRMVLNALWVVPENITADCGQDYLAKHPVGTGPYRLASSIPDDVVVLERFDGYRREQPGAPKKVQIKIVSDPNAAYQSFVRGELDVLEVAFGKLADAQTIAKSGGHYYQQVAGNGLDYVILKNDQAPFDDLRVRRALNLVVDRKALATALSGYGVPAYGFLPPPSPAYRGLAALEKSPLAFDPEMAKKLMADYLREKGLETLDIELFIEFGEVSELTAAFLQDSLAKYLPRINVKISKLSFSAMVQKILGGGGQYCRFWWLAVTPGDDIYFAFYMPGQAPPNGFNISFYESPEFVAQYFAAMATPMYHQARTKALRKLEDIMISDAVAVPLLNRYYHFLSRKGINLTINSYLRKSYISASKGR